MNKRFKSLFFKILIPVILITTILLCITQYVSKRAFEQIVDLSGNAQIEMIGNNVLHEMDLLEVLLISQLKAIADSSQVREGFLKNDREIMHREILEFSRDVPRPCDFFTICDHNNIALIKTTDLNDFGKPMSFAKTTREALAGKVSCYIESTKNNPLALRAAVPMVDENEKVVGLVSGGFRLNTEDFVDRLKSQFGADVTIFLGEERIMTTLKNAQGTRAIGTKLNNEVIRSRVFDKKENYPGEGESNKAMVLGQDYRVFYHPLVGSEGETLGILFAGVSMEAQGQLIRQNMQYNIIIAAVGLIFFACVVIYTISKILKPLHHMTEVANQLAAGSLQFDLHVNTGDELQMLADSFNLVGESLKEKAMVARSIAQNDLKTWVPLRSDEDELGIALIDMRYAIYDSVKDLTSHASNMFTESDNLAKINQSLVAGSVESATALENISNSIKSLNEQTIQNADNARHAEQLTTEARDGSSKGAEKMNEMVNSMNSITQSSDEIKKIIRVIDDIAFQTNLLALNAAVEAARAGTHGKGFAVVAEEVRNLASRSAKAAHETASLIEESIRQVGEGNKIADDTASALTDITNNVIKVNETVGRIASESEQQTQELGSITTAVTQVNASAHETMQRMTEAAETMNTIAKTAEELELITKRFNFNPDGKVYPPGDKEAKIVPKEHQHYWAKKTEAQLKELGLGGE